MEQEEENEEYERFGSSDDSFESCSSSSSSVCEPTSVEFQQTLGSVDLLTDSSLCNSILKRQKVKHYRVHFICCKFEVHSQICLLIKPCNICYSNILYEHNTMDGNMVLCNMTLL